MVPFHHPSPANIHKWASKNLSRYVNTNRGDLVNLCLNIAMLCRTPLQITKWSSSQSPGALTANVSRNFSVTSSRTLRSMLLSILNQTFGLWHDVFTDLLYFQVRRARGWWFYSTVPAWKDRPENCSQCLCQWVHHATDFLLGADAH